MIHDEFIRDFIIEGFENLDQVDRDLLKLEKAPNDVNRLANVFRAVHTIKGTCGFFGISKLEAVAHAGESLLSQLRDGNILLSTDCTSALLGMADAMRAMLHAIEITGVEGEQDYDELVKNMSDLAADSQVAEAKLTSSQIASLASVDLDTAPLIKLEDQLTPTVATNGESNRHTPLDLVERSVVHPEQNGVSIADSNIRVDVALLDRLMNLVGELVLARNQLVQQCAGHHDAALVGTSQRLNLITTELQASVMKTRMQPIGSVWSKFPRVVRDLEAACGKQVRVDMEGQATELDKSIIEAIKDPLTHIVRNAVDHGIESPAVRTGRGKPARGRLLLRAFHEGGQVIIEISDDGGGIDPERIKNKALERGLIGRDQASQMSEREALQLVFLPGFSTAEKVTNISGRGVGMDVVKTNIEKISGTIDLQSQAGQGTTIRIKIPLTLAIIPALIISCGDDRFAIPQASLLELLRLEGEGDLRKIERIREASVYRLRGKLLPLVYLHEQLQLQPRPRSADIVNIVVLRADDRSFGLVVDAIRDTEEIVVKPLSPQLKSIAAFSGATIMGDGQVALILDVLGIAQKSGVVGETRERSNSDVVEAESIEVDPKRALLICGIGGHRQIAIPLDSVDRLEDVPAEKIEYSMCGEVIQYRDQIMPLLRMGNLLSAAQHPIGDSHEGRVSTLKVVVHSDGHQRVGLVVDEIVDIIHTTVELAGESRTRGVVGSIIVQGRVTDLVDVSLLVAGATFETIEELALA